MEEKLKEYSKQLDEIKENILSDIKYFNDKPCRCGSCSMQAILTACDVISRFFEIDYKIELLPKSFLIAGIDFYKNDKFYFTIS